MNKDQASKLYLKLNRMHRELHIASYGTLGELVNADINVAKDALKRALEDLKKIIEV